MVAWGVTGFVFIQAVQTLFAGSAASVTHRATFGFGNTTATHITLTHDDLVHGSHPGSVSDRSDVA